MTQRVLYFFPHNLFASRSGAHQRGLEMLCAMADLGCDVTLFSSVVCSDTPWTGFSPGATPGRPCRELVLHRPTGWESAYLSAGRMAYHGLKRWSRKAAGRIEARSIATSALVPTSMRAAFRRTIERTDPDLIFMTYAWWDGLVDHARERHRRQIIDTIDLISVAMHLRTTLKAAIGSESASAAQMPAEVLQEDFFDRHRDPGERLQLECDIYDRYDVTIAISAAEGKVMADKTHHTRVATIPMTRAPVNLANTYRGPALFAAGMNPFNVHGYAYFVARVLPRVLACIPAFSLDVTGAVCPQLSAAEHVHLRGIVDHLDQVYADAAFVINPVYGGTGQQVKIVDAMAHGVPVVALASAAVGSPIRHGENGLVANDAHEFAEHVERLWRDRALCARLGANARATIASECSPVRLREAMQDVLRPRAPPSDGTDSLAQLVGD